MWSRGCGMWRGYGLHPSGTLFYRPQQSWGKVMFLHVSVILFTGGVCPIACWGTPPGADPLPGADSPWEQTPPGSRHPPGADTTPAEYMLRDTGNKRDGMHPTGMQSCC